MEASQAHQGSLGPRSRSGNSTPPAGTDDLEEPLLQGGRAAGGGKDSKSKEGKGAEGGAPKREPVALPCGHVFCETCIDEWMKSHPTCPICRKDPTRPDLPPGGGGGGGGNDDDSRRPPPPPNPQQPDHRHQQQQGAGGCCQPEQPSPSSRAQPSSGGFFAPRRPYRPTMRMAAMDIGPELVFRLGSLRVSLPSSLLPPHAPVFPAVPTRSTEAATARDFFLRRSSPDAPALSVYSHWPPSSPFPGADPSHKPFNSPLSAASEALPCLRDGRHGRTLDPRHPRRPPHQMAHRHRVCPQAMHPPPLPLNFRTQNIFCSFLVLLLLALLTPAPRPAPFGLISQGPGPCGGDALTGPLGRQHVLWRGLELRRRRPRGIVVISAQLSSFSSPLLADRRPRLAGSLLVGGVIRVLKPNKIQRNGRDIRVLLLPFV